MASFFDNTKVVGTAFVIVAIIEIVAAVLSIIAGFGNAPEGDAYKDVTNWMAYCIIVGVGSLICALLYAFFAFKVFNGSLSEKIVILASYVRIVGLVTAIGGIFGAVGAIAGGLSIGASVVSGIILVVIGLIIMFIAGKINDGKQTTGDKIIWILLLVVFIIMLILNVLAIVGSFNPLSITGIVAGIADVIIALFMIAFLFDSDVKSKMNM